MTAGSGPDAAAAGTKKKAEATAKQAIAEIRKEAKANGYRRLTLEMRKVSL